MYKLVFCPVQYSDFIPCNLWHGCGDEELIYLKRGSEDLALRMATNLMTNQFGQRSDWLTPPHQKRWNLLAYISEKS